MAGSKEYRLTMPEAQHAELKRMSKDTGISMNAIILIAIKDAIRQHKGE